MRYGSFCNCVSQSNQICCLLLLLQFTSLVYAAKTRHNQHHLWLQAMGWWKSNFSFFFFCWHYFHSALWNDSSEVSVIKIYSQEHYWLRNTLPPEELVPAFQKSYFLIFLQKANIITFFYLGSNKVVKATQKEHLPVFISLLDRGSGWVQWPLLLYEVQTLWAVCNQASSTRHQAITPDLWP